MSKVSYDAATQILSYREHIPEIWAVQEYVSPNRSIFFAVIMGIVGFLLGIGIMQSLPGGGMIGLICAGLGWLIGQFSKKLRPPTEAELTGVRQKRLNNGVMDFVVEWRLNNKGGVALYREFDKVRSWSYPRKTGDSGMANFAIGEVAAVERRQFMEVVPNFTRQIIAMKSRADPCQAELVRLILKDGQQLDAGWTSNPNEAARLQSDLIACLDELRRELEKQQVREARKAALDPDDAPL